MDQHHTKHTSWQSLIEIHIHNCVFSFWTVFHVYECLCIRKSRSFYREISLIHSFISVICGWYMGNCLLPLSLTDLMTMGIFWLTDSAFPFLGNIGYVLSVDMILSVPVLSLSQRCFNSWRLVLFGVVLVWMVPWLISLNVWFPVDKTV